MSHPIQHAVDQLLLEQGEYSPLELLLAEGRLDYSDYEAWRTADIPRLEQVLFGDPERLDGLLAEAQEYATALGLQPETLRYHAWGDSGGSPLSFSDNIIREQRFHTVFRKANDQPQFDLFMDATATSLANGIVLALIDRNNEEAHRLLDQLYEVDPGHPPLGALERMVEAGDRLIEPVADCEWELRYLMDELLPLAERELGRESRNLLVPYWQRLTDALEDLAFDPTRPELHASYAASRAFDWETVRRATQEDPGWPQQALLLRRHAHACGRLHNLLESLQSWIRLCWSSPHEAAAIATEADTDLQQMWRLFLTLDPELTAEDFPAWLLLIRPGLARQLPPPEGDELYPPSYVRVYHMLREDQPSQNTPGATEIERRGELKQLNPALFIHYMRARTAL
ncbi:MAG: hypothetical protein OI74_13570 [Gammaproteobacteria bacterium (ex Lamellibrachia satsuma)]|nr:MAG: hypothetical protein HPY30_16445 [Gammaproteobacteria bacterium (ex Lamellibrachia satsuma)]RRS31659.1 MAG: hypothetical protein OI74_13570 [Gammaproteobacteria bacterium (ex Lamellibrachia satsuma)]RRS36149.1 MAG: hypothetical protein NV67_08590 [Gammaproteobacteria bacterium (ex Lamellibrachia satsuma)]